MSRGKLLLADDSVTIQKVVNLTFADEGIEVVTAGNGDVAMEMIAESRPDVVLADVNMPGLNGYQICERLRQSEATKNLPVMLLVGSFEPFDEVEANRVGASGFITKPFQSIRQLVTQVSDLLERSIEDSDHAAHIDDDGSGDIESTQEGTDHEGELWSTAETAAPQNEPPETDDIEDLYNQSFADTVEIPETNVDNGDVMGDLGMDDEIIETTYLSSAAHGTERSPALSERSPFEERVTDEVAVQAKRVEIINDRTEAPHEDSSAQSAFDDRLVTDVMDVLPSDESLQFVPDNRGFDDSVNFSLSGSELLELPNPAEHLALKSVQRASQSQEITNLSPELIDLIVQKVIEKMSERG